MRCDLDTNVTMFILVLPDGKVMAALEDQVLSSNPLLETFGKCRNVKKRQLLSFRKFILINLNIITGSIVGAARISNYLLEKDENYSLEIEGKRNYYIFYQLFCCSES